MGKRSNFERLPKDKYKTPVQGVHSLRRHLPPGSFTFAELCAGDGRLINHIEAHSRGRCVLASDIDPEAEWITEMDALTVTPEALERVDLIITNPPWTRSLLHPMIDRFRKLRTTWLLFDSDWAFTEAAGNLLPYCSDMIPTPRLKWLEDTPHSAKDNTAWYRFVADDVGGPRLHPRVAMPRGWPKIREAA